VKGENVKHATETQYAKLKVLILAEWGLPGCQTVIDFRVDCFA